MRLLTEEEKAERAYQDSKVRDARKQGFLLGIGWGLTPLWALLTYLLTQ